MDWRAARAGCLVVVVASPVAVACGSRTALLVCTRAGETRACENACGVGSQACVDDRWTDCAVPVATRACSNACGPGTQTCADGAWSTCAVPVAERACASRCDAGTETCADGAWGACDAPLPAPPAFTAVIRDFNDTHPDFESDGGVGLDPGIVATVLDTEDKPVYAGDASTKSTHGAAYFYEWYHDTQFTVSSPDASMAAEINMTTSYALSLGPDASTSTTYTFLDPAFFPIDNRLLGNQGRPHNYDFTLELEANFQYMGGETFSFGSDDDSWVFVNRRLAVDLGGIHPATTMALDLDAKSQALGITKGGTYPMHLFYAERHVVGAVLRIEVTANDFAVCR